MKRSFIFAGLAAAAFMLGACGGSSSPSDDEEDILSSADEKGKSSSSEEKIESSSSSLDFELPTGTRVATLEDLERNMTLKGLFGRDIYLSAGSKHGLFSLWIPDTAWIAAPSDFADGKLDFGRAAFLSIDSDEKAVKSMEKLAKDSSAAIYFVVNEDDELQYSLDGKEFDEVGEAKVKANSSLISNGDSLSGKILACTDPEDKNAEIEYTFYDGRFVSRHYTDGKKGDKVESFAGYYDIHRGSLLLRTLFATEASYPMEMASVANDFSITFDANQQKLTCKAENFDYKPVSAKDLAQEWDFSGDGLDWTFNLRTDGSFELKAYEGREGAELKKGIWDVYGDVLVMKVTGCLHTGCTTAVFGAVSDLDPETGFVFEHSDTDEPLIPKTWNAPVYED